MDNFERKEWDEHVARLQSCYDNFNHYDAGYTQRQKQKFTSERLKAIQDIKRELDWPPFAEIARQTTYSSFGFDECYDSMDMGMEQTISNIFNFNK